MNESVDSLAGSASRDEAAGNGDGGRDTGDIHMSTGKLTFYLLTLQIGVGIFGIPSVFHTLGVVISTIAIFVIALMSYGTGLLFYQFRSDVPSVRTASDVGFVLYRRVGRELVLWVLVTYQCFVCSASLIMTRLAMEIIAEKAICSMVYSALATLLFYTLSISVPFKKLGYLGLVSLFGIVGVILAVVALGIKRTGFRTSRLILFPPDPRPFVIFTGLTNLVFIFSGAALFIPVMGVNERFPMAFGGTWTLLTIIFIFVGLLGRGAVEHQPHVTIIVDSLSQDPLARKVLWGFCVVIAIIGGSANGAAAIELLCSRFVKPGDSSEAAAKPEGTSPIISACTWTRDMLILYRYRIGLGGVFWILSFLVAEGIPWFSPLLGIIASIFIAILNYILPSLSWLHLWRRRQWIEDGDSSSLETQSEKDKTYLTSFSPLAITIVTILAILGIIYAVTLMAVGLYANITTVLHLSQKQLTKSPFRCE